MGQQYACIAGHEASVRLSAAGTDHPVWVDFRLIPPTTTTTVGFRLELPPLYLRDYVKNKPHYAAFDWSSVKIGCQRIRMALCSTNSQCSLVRVGWELGSLSSLPLQAIALKVNAGPMFGNTLFQLPVEETVILVTPGYVGDTRNEDATIRLKL